MSQKDVDDALGRLDDFIKENGGRILSISYERIKPWSPEEIRSLYENPASRYSTAWELKEELDQIANQVADYRTFLSGEK
jgi:DNA-directed RNA polymerase subunit F